MSAPEADGTRRSSILVVTDYYPPQIGGGQRASRELARQLAARGHAVAVATVWQPDTPKFELDDGVPVHRIDQVRTLLKPLVASRQQHHPPFPDPVFVSGLRRILRRRRPDVVYVYGWVAYSFMAANVGLRIPFVLGVHDYGSTCPTRTLLYRGGHCPGPSLGRCLACSHEHYGLARGTVTALAVSAGRPWLRRRAGGLHAISAYVAAVTRRDLSLTDGSIPSATIPSFSEETETEGERAEVEASVAGLPETPFILFVGALTRRKGLDVLLEAYRGLVDPPPLVLIGTRSPETPALFHDGVTVLTDVPHGGVMTAWDRCLFGVAPSLWPEPLGLVVREAMRQGRAVIGTTPSGHDDLIVPEQTGVLVPPGDAGALRDAMARLIADDDLRARLGRAASERAATLGMSVLVPSYERLLAAVARRDNSGTASRA